VKEDKLFQFRNPQSKSINFFLFVSSWFSVFFVVQKNCV